MDIAAPIGPVILEISVAINPVISITRIEIFLHPVNLANPTQILEWLVRLS